MEKYWWNIAKKTPYINFLFRRDKIYKNKLVKLWYNLKKTPLNLDRPRTFNEKIQWLNLYDSTPIKTKLTDKYLVRDYIRDKIGEEYLINLLGVYNKFEDIEFIKLPNQFVIKCNHGSGYNIIVKDKSLLNYTDAKLKIDKWMTENYAFKNGLELQYRDIQPKIIIEEFLDDGTGDLNDYKFACFNGNPKFLWVDKDRHSDHRPNLYDLNWNQLPYKLNTYLTFQSPEKPKLLKKMINIAATLSKGFVYARVDLYIVNEKIYFGEITFTFSSGTIELTPKKFDRKVASYIKLPKMAYNIDTGEYYLLNKHISFFVYYNFLIILVLKLLYNWKIIKLVINYKTKKL